MSGKRSAPPAETEPSSVVKRNKVIGEVSRTQWKKWASLVTATCLVDTDNRTGALFKIIRASQSAPFHLDDNAVMQCQVCKALLSPKRKRDLFGGGGEGDNRGHFKACGCKATLMARQSQFDKLGDDQEVATLLFPRLGFKEQREIAALTYADRVIVSETTAGKCDGFKAMIDCLLPYMSKLLGDADNIMRVWVPRLIEARVKHCRELMKNKHLNLSFDSTGDKSTDDPETKKLRGLTCHIPTPERFYSLCLSLQCLPKDRSTAAANYDWFRQVVVDFVGTDDAEAVGALLSSISTDWGSDNTGKDCMEVFKQFYLTVLWFRCLAHLLDLVAKELRNLEWILRLYELTNMWSNANNAYLPTEFITLQRKMLVPVGAGDRVRGLPQLVTPHGLLLQGASTPPAVGATRWVSFWRWLVWTHARYLPLVYFATNTIVGHESSSAKELTDHLSNDTTELFLAMDVLLTVSEPIRRALTMLQSRQPHIHKVVGIFAGIKENLSITKEEVRALFAAAYATLQSTLVVHEGYARLFNDLSQNEIKAQADFFLTVVQVALAKLVDIYETNYPANEKRFIEVCPSIDPETRLEDRGSFQVFKNAITWTHFIEGDERVAYDWDQIEHDWNRWCVDNRSFDEANAEERSPEYAYQWWTEPTKFIIYPHLAPLVIRMLEVIPNSCDPERLFSVFKRVIVSQNLRWNMESIKKVGLVQCTYNMSSGPPQWTKDWPMSHFRGAFSRV